MDNEAIIKEFKKIIKRANKEGYSSLQILFEAEPNALPTFKVRYGKQVRRQNAQVYNSDSTEDKEE